MKSIILGAALFAAASAPALAQSNDSITLGQPGFYGRVDIGDYVPRPVVYAPQPVIIAPRAHYAAAPIYLRVPPGHRRDWRRFCGRYEACGRPVLFVRDDWYTNTYVPRYRDYHYGPRHGYRGGPEFHGRGPDRGWDRDRGWEHGRGHGNGHGGGHGGGHGNGHGGGHGGDHGNGR